MILYHLKYALHFQFLSLFPIFFFPCCMKYESCSIEAVFPFLSLYFYATTASLFSSFLPLFSPSPSFLPLCLSPLFRLIFFLFRLIHSFSLSLSLSHFIFRSLPFFLSRFSQLALSISTFSWYPSCLPNESNRFWYDEMWPFSVISWEFNRSGEKYIDNNKWVKTNSADVKNVFNFRKKEQ